MKKKLIKTLESLPFFTKNNLLTLERVKNKAMDENLQRWVGNGDLVRLKNGIFVTKTYLDRHLKETGYFELIAGTLLAPSYLSLEYVLQKHNLLTEATYPVTSVTLKTPRRFRNNLGSFVYHRLHPKLYFGFERRRYGENFYYEAISAKALFDFLYLKSASLDPQDVSTVESLRINWTSCDEKMFQEFRECIAKSGVGKMNVLLPLIEEVYHGNIS